MKCIRSQQAFNNNVAKETLPVATGKLFLPLVLLETLHGEGLPGAEGAQATTPNGWQRRWPSNSTDPAHLPRAGEAAANRPAEMPLQSGLGSAQPRSLSPSISCPAGCQGGSPLGSPCQPDWKRQMQADRAGVWRRSRLCPSDG